MQAVRPDDAETQVIRSFLFVPADSEKKLLKAAGSGADALILDLEDSVRPPQKGAARRLAREFLGEQRGKAVWVRINPIDTEAALDDLRALLPAAPAGIVLPKPAGAADSWQLARLLDELEQEHHLPAGETGLMPIATERPTALFGLHEYAESPPRLRFLTWGAEDLSAAVGATANRDERGRWLAPYELARSLCLFAAAAAGVPAIDTVWTDFRDTAGLEGSAARARRDGFAGMLAIHPSQVDIINEAFTPSAEEVDRARKIVELFAAHPDAGVLALDGEMIDRPHWLQARRVLDAAALGEPHPAPKSPTKRAP
jgi:citrate lyase subunit beta/citryl-CoA lyase